MRCPTTSADVAMLMTISQRHRLRAIGKHSRANCVIDVLSEHLLRAHVAGSPENQASRSGTRHGIVYSRARQRRTHARAMNRIEGGIAICGPAGASRACVLRPDRRTEGEVAESIPSILGDVMAHELGHLMLRPPGHSLDGIMRPNVPVRPRSLDTFTKSQAREILLRLSQLP
jgi:hypothetical protein